MLGNSSATSLSNGSGTISKRKNWGKSTLKVGFAGTRVESIEMNVVKPLNIEFCLDTPRGSNQGRLSRIIMHSQRSSNRSSSGIVNDIAAKGSTLTQC